MNETDKISYALIELGYNSGWLVRGTEIEWLDEPATKPTKKQIDAKVLEIESILESKAQAEKALKVAAYQKLGLTEEEINVILN